MLSVIYTRMVVLLTLIRRKEFKEVKVFKDQLMDTKLQEVKVLLVHRPPDGAQGAQGAQGVAGFDLKVTKTYWLWCTRCYWTSWYTQPYWFYCFNDLPNNKLNLQRKFANKVAQNSGMLSKQLLMTLLYYIIVKIILLEVQMNIM